MLAEDHCIELSSSVYLSRGIVIDLFIFKQFECPGEFRFGFQERLDWHNGIQQREVVRDTALYGLENISDRSMND